VSASAGVARFWKVRGAVVAIGLQKLSAGSGDEYLTRQVAAMDATGRGHSTLSDYYSARGESPGHWYGGCLARVGLAPGDPVTAEQMKLLEKLLRVLCQQRRIAGKYCPASGLHYFLGRSYCRADEVLLQKSRRHCQKLR